MYEINIGGDLMIESEWMLKECHKMMKQRNLNYKYLESKYHLYKDKEKIAEFYGVRDLHNYLEVNFYYDEDYKRDQFEYDGNRYYFERGEYYRVIDYADSYILDKISQNQFEYHYYIYQKVNKMLSLDEIAKGDYIYFGVMDPMRPHIFYDSLRNERMLR